MEDRSNQAEEKNKCVICQEDFVQEQNLLKFSLRGGMNVLAADIN